MQDEPQRRLVEHQAAISLMRSLANARASLVDVDDFGDGPGRGRARANKRFLDRVDNVKESNSAIEEGGHGFLIGGIEHDRCCAARFQRLARHPQRRETCRDRALRRSACRSGPDPAFRAGVSIRSGQASA